MRGQAGSLPHLVWLARHGGAIYRGIIPFVLIQLVTIIVVWFLPDLVLAIPMAGE